MAHPDDPNPNPDAADPWWRDPDVDPAPVYDINTTDFTPSLHYNGGWTISGGHRGYVGGRVACSDYLDWDYFSRLDVDHLAKEVGQECNAGYWFVPRGCEVNDGMTLYSDEDCHNLFRDLQDRQYRDAYVYVVRAILAHHPDDILATSQTLNLTIFDGSESDPDFLPSEHTEDEADATHMVSMISVPLNDEDVNNDPYECNYPIHLPYADPFSSSKDESWNEEDEDVVQRLLDEYDDDGYAVDLVQSSKDEGEDVDMTEEEYAAFEEEVQPVPNLPADWFNTGASAEAGSDLDVFITSEDDAHSFSEDSDGDIIF